MTNITHTFWVFALLRLVDTEKFLILQRSDYKDRNPLHRDIPGGSLDIWEQVEQAMHRELLEEICIVLNPKEQASFGYLGTRSRWTNHDHTRWSTVVFYTAILDSPEIQLSNEHTSHQRLTTEEIMQISDRVDLVDEALKLYQQPPPNTPSPKIDL